MSEIRSVSVHLDADVASYVAKMRLAGAETDKAFSSSGRSIDTTNSKLAQTEAALSKVDTQARRVETSISRVGTTTRRVGDSDFSRATSKVDGFLGKLGLIPALAIAGSAALVPLAAAATGVVAAFAAPIAFAGGGLTLFGLLGGAAISTTQKQFKAIDALNTKLAGLTKGTKDYTVVQHQLAAAEKALSPQQRAFHDSLEGLQSDFAKFIRGPAGQDLLGPFTQGLKIADDLLPKSAPIIHAVSGALGDLFGQFDRYIKSPGFSRLEHDIVGQIGPDLRIFGHIIGDVTPGVATLLDVLGKHLSPLLMSEVERLAGGFSSWAQSKGARQDVKSFIRYFHEVAPGVGRTIEEVARAIGHIVSALAPLGPGTLAVVRGIVHEFNQVPIPVLTGIAAAAAGLVTLQKVGGFKALNLAGNVLGGAKSGGVKGALGGIISGGVQKVYVVNMPGSGFPGAPGAPGGGGGGFWDRFKKWGGFPEAGAAGAEGAGASAGAVLGTAAAAVVAAGVIGYLQRNVMPYGPHGSTDPGIARGGTAAQAHFGVTPAPSPPSSYGPATSPYVARGGQAAAKAYQDATKAVTSFGTRVEALHAHLGKASQDMELVGHSADRAFNGGAKDVEQLSGTLNTIKGAGAAQQLELVGMSSHKTFASARADVDQFTNRVDSALHPIRYLRVQAQIDQAVHALDVVAAKLASIRSKTITLTTQRVTGGHVTGGADGGTIGGAPRSPYGDKVLIAAAPGEEIISNRHGQADRFRADRSAGRIPGYAGGGTVGPDFTGVAVTPGQPITNHIARVTAELHHLQLALKDSTSELDKERAHRQALAQQRQQLVSTVKGGFLSQIFGVVPDNGIWAPGAGKATDPAQILHHDIRDAREYRGDLRKLKRRGLAGGALAQVTTLDAAQQALGLSPHELRETSRLFRIRNRVAQGAGADLGNDIYGRRLAESNRHLDKIKEHTREIRHEIHDLTQEVKQLKHDAAKHAKAATANAKATGAAVGSAINGAASTAVKRRTTR